MSERESSLQIIDRQDLSIAELTDAMKQGKSVIRTPHVGNLSPYNLALAAEGIPLLLVDQNVGGYDTTYYPEAVVTRAGKLALADLHTVSARTVVEQGEVTCYLDEYHIAALQRAVPGADAYTNTEYQRRNEAVVGEITLLAAHQMPELFKRVVRADGTTERSGRESVGLTLAGKTLQLGDDPRAEQRAALIPNEVNIVANFVVESLLTEQDEQFHISGPAMAVYLRDAKMADPIQRLYALIKNNASFKDQLPPVLTVMVVDATDARFATTEDQAEQLDALVAAYDAMDQELADSNSQRRDFFATDASRQPQARTEFLSRIGQLEQAARDRVVEAMAVVPDTLNDAHAKGTTSFTSQYDVFALGGLYVAQANRIRSFAELSTMTKRLRKLAKGERV